ncbi:type 4a pilus biogenesis protein PilO [Patescibacteria group bacterium]
MKIRQFSDHPSAKISLALILALFATSFFGIFAIKPTFITIARLTREIKDSKKVNGQLEEKIKSLQQAQIAYSELEKDLIYVYRTMPTKPDFNRFASEINYLTYTNDLTLLSVNYSKFSLLPPGAGTSTIRYKISLAGDYINIKNFLKDLENLDRISTIKSTKFSPKTEVENAELSLDILAEAYWISLLEKE